jgi:hypothetical protein
MGVTRRAWSTVAAGAVAASTVTTLVTPASAIARSTEMMGVMAAIATKTTIISPVVRVNQVGYYSVAALFAFALGAAGLG